MRDSLNNLWSLVNKNTGAITYTGEKVEVERFSLAKTHRVMSYAAALNQHEPNKTTR